MGKFKFESQFDAEVFAISEGLIPVDDFGKYDLDTLVSLNESVTSRRLLDRSRRVREIVNATKSRTSKKNWKHKRARYMESIRKFHKSVKGKRVHQKVAQARKDGKYSNVYESHTMLNSIISRLSINASYTSDIYEEADRIVLLMEGVELLSPVLTDLLNGEVENLNDRLDLTEAGIFIDDLFGISEDIDYNPGDVSAADILSDASVEDRLIRDPQNPEGDGSTEDGEDPQGDDPDASVNVNEEHDLSFDDSELVVNIVESLDDVDHSTREFYMITESGSDDDVDGEHVIAKIVGPSFFPGAVSRNNVEYTDVLWNTVLSDPAVRKELDARRVYGTFGHKVKIDDDALRQGLISHIVKDIYRDESGTGIGEYLVLNTDAGRNLRTYFGAKSRIRVSTRCRGTYLSTRNARGHKEPDPKTFQFKGIDFVHDPGFLDAEPSMAA